MDIVKEIADYVEDGGYGTVGTDIFIGELNIKAPANSILLTAMPSEMPNKYVDIYYQNIEIYVRNNEPSDCQAKVQLVFDYLHRKSGVTTTNAYIHFIHAIEQVESVGRDIENRSLYKFIIKVIYRRT